MLLLENDGVVDEVLLKCFENSYFKVEVVNLQFINYVLVEMFDVRIMKNGVFVLFLKVKNWGLMYFCKFQRIGLEFEYDLQYKV